MHDDRPNSKSDFIKTPHLEYLAQKGVRFSQGYALHPNCSPSRYSITGKSPAKLHATDIVKRFSKASGSFYKGNKLNPPTGSCVLKSTDTTMAQWIKKHRPEYATAHFGKWHLEGDSPEQFGFDKSDGKTSNKEGNKKDSADPKSVFSLTKRAKNWI